MNSEIYATYQIYDNTYEFSSTGRRGVFEMRIVFEQIGDDVYNLAFGVWDPASETIDDSQALRNGDMDKILATVGVVAIEFLQVKTTASLIAAGRTLPGQNPTRTRKYRMSISKHLEWLIKDHQIYGFVADRDEDEQIIGQWPFGWSGNWRVFNRETNFDAFLLRRK